jgi:hypothetical protein
MSKKIMAEKRTFHFGLLYAHTLNPHATPMAILTQENNGLFD